MTATDFKTTILVDIPAPAVYEAINNVRGWWQGEIDGNTDTIDEAFIYRMPSVHYSKQRIVELIPNKKIKWLVIDSELTFTQTKTEWVGTTIVFDIEEINGKTQVRFTHVGLIPSLECYGGCSNGWEKLIQQSLFSLITTGKGVDVF